MTVLNVDAAVRRAVQRIGKINSLPFVTDHAMESVFGAEAGNAIRALDEESERQGICAGCAGLCCRQMRCVLFRTEFGRCPIHRYRPVLCRFNYCYRFGKNNTELAKDLIAIATETVASLPSGSRAAEALAFNALLYGECRSESEGIPQPAAPFQQIVKRVERRSLSLEAAENSLQDLARSFVLRQG